MPPKQLIVVAGPNGAGKSTFVSGFLSEHLIPYLSADLIATELSIEEPASLQFAAGQESIRRIEKQLLAEQDFIAETTLSGRTWKNYMSRAQTLGFEITVFFVYLDSADTCVARVRERVRRGGHNVPEADIRRRFSRSVSNFWKTYRQIADHWAVVYNVGSGFVDVAFGVRDDFAVSDDDLFHRFLKLTEGDGNG